MLKSELTSGVRGNRGDDTFGKNHTEVLICFHVAHLEQEHPQTMRYSKTPVRTDVN